MELGMIGLGRMGANMSERLVHGGHRVIGFDPQPQSRKRAEDAGAHSAASLDALVAKLDELEWRVHSPTVIIQAKDPLEEMSRFR